MSLRSLPHENDFYCHYETCFCFVLQVNKLVFLLISFMKGLCSPRVLTLFNTLFIFVLFDIIICCPLLYYLYYYYYYLKSHFLFYFKVAAMVQNRLRKKIWISVVELTGALLFSHVLYFLLGVWQLDIGMRLSGAFCLKSGRDLHFN